MAQEPAESCPEDCPVRGRLADYIAELERNAATDALTQVWNRAQFDRIAVLEIARSLRYKQPLSLVLFDLDNFKRVNDQFGHQAGDAVLREVARIAATTIRTSDAIFRWGGEEFVVLAVSSGHRGAARLAESLRRGVAEHHFSVAGSLTISLGVAEHAGTEGVEGLFRRADSMLYAAKQEGRNAVRVDPHGNSDTWIAASGLSLLQLAWQREYECGEQTIDSEHEELFTLANQLIDTAISMDDRLTSLTGAYDHLLARIAAHFATEESLLEQHDYADLAAHRAAHDRLLQRAQELRFALVAGDASLGDIIEYVVRDVVMRHLLTADRRYFPLFAAAGTGG